MNSSKAIIIIHAGADRGLLTRTNYGVAPSWEQVRCDEAAGTGRRDVDGPASIGPSPYNKQDG